MNATPENFKPGERWLFSFCNKLLEVICIEWSPSGTGVKICYPGTPILAKCYDGQWLTPDDLGELHERLPDVESGNHKTESPRRLETDSIISFAKLFVVNWGCQCRHCKVVKAKTYTRIQEIEKEIFENAETKC